MVTFSITGTLSGSVTRDQAEDLIKEAGHEFSRQVTRKTDYLVACELGTGKYEQAIKKGALIITESEFWDFLDLPIESIPREEKNKIRIPSSIQWIKRKKESEDTINICYHDEYGVISDRIIVIIADGELVSKVGSIRYYIQAIDKKDGKVRTFRRDRIIEIRETT